MNTDILNNNSIGIQYIEVGVNFGFGFKFRFRLLIIMNSGFIFIEFFTIR